MGNAAEQLTISDKTWNVMFVTSSARGTPTASHYNPEWRGEALAAARRLAKSGWRAWVEHRDTGVRIYQSESEARYLSESQALRELSYRGAPGALDPRSVSLGAVERKWFMYVGSAERQRVRKRRGLPPKGIAEQLVVKGLIEETVDPAEPGSLRALTELGRRRFSTIP